MTYPKLPGPPTKPGWYWRDCKHRYGLECVNVFEGDVRRCTKTGIATVHGLCTWERSNHDEDVVARLLSEDNLPAVWYGPIPEPTTGEREPCKAWREEEPGALILRSTTGDLLAAVSAGGRGAWLEMWESSRFKEYPTTRAAQLAAEDAIRQECNARLAVLDGRPANAR
jgi:hypothetical protein